MNQDQVITKPHVVCVPFPAQGHITPMLQLSKLLHSFGFHVTFVNTEFNHRRLIRSGGPHAVKGLPDFRFETIPDGLPPSDRDATQDPPALSDSVRKNCLVPFMELIVKLNSSSSPVSCIVCDGLTSFGTKVGKEMGIPVIQFWTASACGLMGYLQCDELVKRGIVPFKDEKFLSDGTLDTPIDWIPGMSNIRLKDFPSFIRTTDPNDIMFNFQKSEARNCLDSSAILINTFDDFEYEVLQSITSIIPNIYTIGPLNLLCRKLLCETKYKSLRSSLWKEDSECVEWLDKREPHSVVYVNYGSVTVMSDQHFREFAWGLANSKHPFLWVVRPDIAKGDSVTFPEEYLEEIKDRGIITSWCPQEEVLSHASIGAFLTHCGWNSIMESMCEGVPLICWPFFAEQQTNCRYACTGTWGIGMEVNHDVKRGDIESIVKEMMEGDKGKELKLNAQEWKRKVEVATSAGGSSYRNLNRFVKEVLHHENEQK